MTGSPERGPAIRPLGPGDRPAFLDAVARSRELHHPWAYPPDTPEAFDAYVEADPTRCSLGVFIQDGTGLAGVYTLSQIHRGAFRNAYLGYYAFVPHAGTGVMRAAMPLVLRHAFGELRLHRLQANVQPGNDRSIALLRATGWTQEGFARRYLKIGGRWRDHVLFAILAEDVAGRGAPRTT